jgi:cytochrome b involved in lipid metabolism
MKILAFASTVAFVLAAAALGAWHVGADDRRPSQPASNPPRLISVSELATHASRPDSWIALRGQVYDVTRYIDRHPTPAATIVAHCGTDATNAYKTKESGGRHSPRSDRELQTLRIGEVIR